jgi:N utilization substance protein A
MQRGYDSLVALPGVGVSLADALYEKGFYSAEEVASATVDDLIQIRGIGEETAVKLIEAAKEALEAAGEEAFAEENSQQSDDENQETTAANSSSNDTQTMDNAEKDSAG